MQAVEKGEDYDLVSPQDGSVTGRLNAEEVFTLLVRKAWESGDPGIVFIDRINRDNPTPALGAIESTNPCGEQPLLPYEACNLGSINLSVFHDPAAADGIDWTGLTETVHLAVRFLDNVIDASRYPLPQITEMVTANRKIGLGLMGFADLLYLLRIPYDSQEALALAEKIMETIQAEARSASKTLAAERGPFPAYPESIYGKRNLGPYRNATTTTIAPDRHPFHHRRLFLGHRTAVRPVVFPQRHGRREVGRGQPAFRGGPARIRGLLRELDGGGHPQGLHRPYRDPARGTAPGLRHGHGHRAGLAFEDAGRLPEIYGQRRVQDGQSAEQRHPGGHPGNLPARLRTGLQGRHRLPRRLQVESGAAHRRRRRRRHDQAANLRARAAGHRVRLHPEGQNGPGQLYLTVNEVDGKPFEVFATIGKSGRSVTAKAEAIGRLVSLALRSGVDVAAIVGQLKGIGGENPVFQKKGLLLSIPDAVARVLENRYLQGKFVNDHNRSARPSPLPGLRRRTCVRGRLPHLQELRLHEVRLGRADAKKISRHFRGTRQAALFPRHVD